ncbi:MAG: 50S ribosomal protein L15 [Firmicutes bacterium]|nr:50S ribosomal protein L15 [Bacillota bacterium]
MHRGDLRPPEGTRSQRKRVGRGTGSGLGKTAGRGHKGQKARAGGSIRPGFEGGQMPLVRRLPKRGFKNIFANRFAVVNVGELERFPAGSSVTPAALRENGLVKKSGEPVKILGTGELTKALSVSVHGFSKTAEEKIRAAGGTVEVI